MSARSLCLIDDVSAEALLFYLIVEEMHPLQFSTMHTAMTAPERRKTVLMHAINETQRHRALIHTRMFRRGRFEMCTCGPGEEPHRAYSITEGGLDRVEFLLAAGPAEPLRPLRAVASGGESSRIMLALKAAPKLAQAAGTLSA
jgi:DNA repair ATPase RecN